MTTDPKTHGFGTRLLADKIIQDQPVVFVKLGDGEAACVRGQNGANCDGDPYGATLGRSLTAAVRYLTGAPSTYFGAWHNPETLGFWQNIAGSTTIRWLHYHSAMPDAPALAVGDLLRLYTAIRDAKRTKILVANSLLSKAVGLLNINSHVVIKQGGWFDSDYVNVVDQIRVAFGICTKPLVVTCCGLAAKVLIADLHRIYPNGIFVDIGSGLDFICTRKDSRGAPFSYDDIERYFKSILPSNWKDESYNPLYAAAAASFGRHL